MINFTVGPVQSSQEVKEIGGENVPYFRTPEFSEIMIQNEALMKEFSGAVKDSKVVFITGSGTASMEAAIINTLTDKDKVLIVNGGSFGQRFVDLCQLHSINYTEIKLDYGKSLKEEHLKKYENKGFTAFLVNVHETSTGVHYDMNLISDFCTRNKLFLIADNISSFLADEFSMDKLKVDVMITGSQKALACPPGISIIVLSPKALERVQKVNCKCMYLDLKNHLKNMERGQTPFTPAVGILLQINARLQEIKMKGGVKFEIQRVSDLAEDFRKRIIDMPFKLLSESPSNAVTALQSLNTSAYDIYTELKEHYGIWVCPNGGELKDKVFRVGHIGNLTIEDNTKLINALKDMKLKGVI